MRSSRRRVWVRMATIGVVAVVLAGAHARVEEQPPATLASPPVPLEDLPAVCATGRELGLRFGSIQPVAMEDNAPLGYQVFPPVISPDRTADFRVVMEFVGDIPTLTVRQFENNEEGFIVVTLERTTTRSVDGRLISIFDWTVPAGVLGSALRYFHGHDSPAVPIGEVELPGVVVEAPIPGAFGGEVRTHERIRVRLLSTNIEESVVQEFTPPETVPTLVEVQAGQYASHVVNLHVPGFGDERVQGGDHAYDLEGVVQALLQRLKDTMEVVAIIPEKSAMSAWAGFHGVVKNDVTGIGLPIFDDSSRYGSAGVLRGRQVYALGEAFQPATFLHEVGHQHGAFFELPELIGVAAAGHEPWGHMALTAFASQPAVATATALGVSQGETLLGSVLIGTRVPTRTTAEEGLAGLVGSEFQIALTGAPIIYNQLQRYAMGFVEAAAVSDIEVFEDQSQFDAETVTAPEVGTTLAGNTQTVTMNQIRQQHGDRSGSVQTHVRMGFVVITRDGLLPQRAMDWFNFYAQRMGADSGTRSYNGFGSFKETTAGAASLATDINPLTDEKINQSLPVSNASFGPSDWRGLILDQAFAGTITTDQRLTLAGRIDTAIHGDTDYVAIIIRFTPYGGGDDLTTQGDVTNGAFSFDASVPQEPGAYVVDIFIYESFESPATATATIQPVFINAPIAAR